jgi:hypothetical protein
VTETAEIADADNPKLALYVIEDFAGAQLAEAAYGYDLTGRELEGELLGGGERTQTLLFGVASVVGAGAAILAPISEAGGLSFRLGPGARAATPAGAAVRQPGAALAEEEAATSAAPKGFPVTRETVGSYEALHWAETEGTTFKWSVMDMKLAAGKQPSIVQLRSFFSEIETRAAAAGATHIEFEGLAIINEGFFSEAVAKRLGYTVISKTDNVVVWSKALGAPLNVNSEPLIVQRCIAVVRKSRYRSKSTKEFGDLPPAVREDISLSAHISDGEFPMVCFYVGPSCWTLMTSERLVWCDESRCRSIPWNGISRVESEEIVISTDGSLHRERNHLIVTSGNKARFEVRVDPRCFAPLLKVAGIMTLATRNSKDRDSQSPTPP